MSDQWSVSPCESDGPGEEHGEADGRLARGGERRDPAALAVPGEAEPRAVDPRLRGEEPHGGLGVPGEGVDRALVGTVSHEHAARLPDAALVVGEHRVAGAGEERGEVREVVARLVGRRRAPRRRPDAGRPAAEGSAFRRAGCAPLRKRTSSWRVRHARRTAGREVRAGGVEARRAA